MELRPWARKDFAFLLNSRLRLKQRTSALVLIAQINHASTHCLAAVTKILFSIDMIKSQIRFDYIIPSFVLIFFQPAVDCGFFVGDLSVLYVASENVLPNC